MSPRKATVNNFSDEENRLLVQLLVDNYSSYYASLETVTKGELESMRNNLHEKWTEQINELGFRTRKRQQIADQVKRLVAKARSCVVAELDYNEKKSRRGQSATPPPVPDYLDPLLVKLRIESIVGFVAAGEGEEPEVEIPEIPAPRGGERSEFSCLLLDDDQRYSEVSAEALLAPSTAEYNRRRPNLRKRPRIQYVDLDEDDEDNGSMSGDVLERPETREAHEVYYGNYAAHEEDASTSALRRRLLLKEIELADLRIEREKKMIQLVDKQLAEELAKRINPSVQSMNSNFQQRQTPTPEMTSNAVINAHCFEDDTKNPTMRHTPEDTCGSCCTSCAEANSRKLDGILEKLKHVESSSSAKSAETGFCFEKIMSELEETNNVLRSVYSKIPKPTTEGPNFALMPKEKVATMRKLRGDNMNKFALDLERELYATGDRKDLTKPVEKRFASADKVAFIKECVFMFYDVHGEAKRTTWLAVRNALNSRVRRLRSSSKGMSVDCPLLESFNYDTDEQKWSDLTQ